MFEGASDVINNQELNLPANEHVPILSTDENVRNLSFPHIGVYLYGNSSWNAFNDAIGKKVIK